MWNDPAQFDALTAASLAAAREARRQAADPDHPPAEPRPAASSPYAPTLPRPGGDRDPFAGLPFP